MAVGTTLLGIATLNVALADVTPAPLLSLTEPLTSETVYCPTLKLPLAAVMT